MWSRTEQRLDSQAPRSVCIDDEGAAETAVATRQTHFDFSSKPLFFLNRLCCSGLQDAGAFPGAQLATLGSSLLQFNFQ